MRIQRRLLPSFSKALSRPAPAIRLVNREKGAELSTSPLSPIPFSLCFVCVPAAHDPVYTRPPAAHDAHTPASTYTRTRSRGNEKLNFAWICRRLVSVWHAPIWLIDDGRHDLFHHHRFFSSSRHPTTALPSVHAKDQTGVGPTAITGSGWRSSKAPAHSRLYGYTTTFTSSSFLAVTTTTARPTEQPFEPAPSPDINSPCLQPSRQSLARPHTRTSRHRQAPWATRITPGGTSLRRL